MHPKPGQRPTLYQYASCPFCWKVKAILYYKKIPFDTVEVNPMSKEEISFSKDYKKVPIYVTADGEQINDSTPIMRRIDRDFPSPQVFETDPELMEIENRWIAWSNEVLVKAMVPVIYDSFFNSLSTFDEILKKGNFAWWQQFYIKYIGGTVMYFVAKKKSKQLGVDNPYAYFQDCLKQWQNGLRGREYLNSKFPNGADLAIWGILRTMDDLPSRWALEKNPVIYNWYSRIKRQVEN